MGKYDQGNTWNIDTDSLFQTMIKVAASITVVAFLFGFTFLCLVALT